MIVGVGIDHVNIARFARTMGRTPALRSRLFAESERGRGLESLAARFAAKEACLKAFRHVPGFAFRDVEVVDDVNGAPRLVLRGAVAQAAADRGVTATSVSLTHEDPLASAIVILEGER